MDNSHTDRRNLHRHMKQDGLALVTVVLIVAIASSIAAFMSLNQQLWFRQTGNAIDRGQAENIYRGAIDFATIVLERDAASNSRDDRQELWAKSATTFPVESGTVSIEVHDAQCRFNLNNVTINGQPSGADIGILRRLFAYLEINQSLVEPLVDWIDADSQTRPGGAEDTEYLSGNVPHRTANQSLTDLEELRMIQGFTPEIIAKLQNVVTVMPAYTSININTAPPAVLGALFVNMPLSTAESLYKSLASSPITKVGDIKRMVDKDYKLANVKIDTKTNYFLVYLDVASGRYRDHMRTLIYRPDNGLASQAIRRDRLPVRVAATDSSG
jgi:general secretion pathway protein K